MSTAKPGEVGEAARVAVLADEHVHAYDCVIVGDCPDCGHLCCMGECPCDCERQPCSRMEHAAATGDRRDDSAARAAGGE